MDNYYEWTDLLDEPTGKRPSISSIGGSVGAAGMDTLIRGVPTSTFADLSDNLKQKFKGAGLSGSRPALEASEFYRESIPYPVRNLGEDAVRRFTDRKDASHIQSVQNAPELARDSSNLIWEKSGINRARGSEDMTRLEVFKANATNTFDTSAIIFRHSLEAGGISALYASLLEAPVATIENYFHYKRNQKTGEEAVKDAAMAIGKRATAGFAIGFTITAALAIVPGANVVLVTVAPVLMPVGIAMYTYNALKRILDAMAYDLPPGLNKVGTYFCSTRCHTKFAYETGMSAFMRWESNRIATR